jgi:HSP20 family molecular chaperone IbpA
VRRTIKLPSDALLDGIHAKLNNGELTIMIPKKVCKTQLLSLTC